MADESINTLVDFRYERFFEAQRGENGSGRNCTGAKGDDREVRVPVGTVVTDADTGEVIGDMVRAGQRVKVAQGGFLGLGNTRYKSSTNRAPRQCKPGTPGERRELHLEMKVLADVGLLGKPNAGKSTFIRAVSSARPKVADYPFTTLYPNLGVVRVDETRSFVIADIPGLIEGASTGAGLGIQFLKHLSDRFSTAEAKVDQKTFNAARIGTLWSSTRSPSIRTRGGTAWNSQRSSSSLSA